MASAKAGIVDTSIVPSDSSVEGRTISVSAVQPSNTPSPMVLSPSGNSMLLSDAHPLKALLPIDVSFDPSSNTTRE